MVIVAFLFFSLDGVTDLLSGTCQGHVNIGGCVIFPCKPCVKDMPRTCQYGPFREHHLRKKNAIDKNSLR